MTRFGLQVCNCYQEVEILLLQNNEKSGMQEFRKEKQVIIILFTLYMLFTCYLHGL